MNAFDGLLPPPATAPPLPHRGGAAAAVAAARTRRRTRAAKAAGTGTVLSMAFGAVLLVLPGPGMHGIVVDPDATPSATAPTRGPGPSRTPDPDGPVRGADPAGAVPAVGAHVPTGTAAPTATGGPTAGPGGPAPSPSPGRRVSRVVRTTVPDDLGKECYFRASTVEPAESLCVRYTGPAEATAGTPTPLSYEFCSRVNDVVLTFRWADEIMVQLFTSPTDVMWRNFSSSPTVEPYDVPLARGSCLRYVVHWDGLDNTGRKPAAGTYSMSGGLMVEDTVGLWTTSQGETLTVR